jgi:hypothetical protein
MELHFFATCQPDSNSFYGMTVASYDWDILISITTKLPASTVIKHQKISWMQAKIHRENTTFLFIAFKIHGVTCRKIVLWPVE